MAQRKTLMVAKLTEKDEAMAYHNVVALNPADFSPFPKFIKVRNQKHPSGILFSTGPSEHVPVGSIGFSSAQRAWGSVADRDRVDVELTKVSTMLSSISLSTQFQKKKFVTKERYDVQALTKAFVETFQNQVFSVDQNFVFQYKDLDEPVFKITVTGMEAVKMDGGQEEATSGIITSGTNLTFASDVVNFGGQGGQKKQTLFDPGWKYEDMGIGGLGSQFREMFRRAFQSRVFPPEFVEKLGISHTKGMMLYGPPGTGKTLMARQIGKMLQGKEPKVVNGPEIMSKYVGESEENVRKLFADAEEEQKQRGENSGLHIIIFDEIDAICKVRGSTSGGTGVADSVVNQLLSKIDGVEALNNVLLIGMTNRLDMIDEALLRPGRFELKLQIGLPDAAGRHEIFKIHTKRLSTNNMLGPNVDLAELAELAKNFSGAEIAGLIRSAVSFATEKCVSVDGTVEVDAKAMENIKVTHSDFLRALGELKPAFGADSDQFDGAVPNGIVPWDLQVDITLQTGQLLVQQCDKSERTPLVSMLLCGAPGTGKTALAARIAQDSDFPFVKLISPENFVGLGESAKVSRIFKVFSDAYKSTKSVIVVDDIERLIEFNVIGHRYSNVVLQALLVLFKKRPPPGHRLLIIATTSEDDILGKMGVVSEFSRVQHLNLIERDDQVCKILEDLDCFNPKMLTEIKASMTGRQLKYQSFDSVEISIGVKKLYMLAEMSKQSPEPADTFLYSFYEECKRSAQF
eukprot:m.249273 g.249273  ORF g.249273 m.249273 type:complete len:743 (-) comp33871_c4_seq1:177-2405(-)